MTANAPTRSQPRAYLDETTGARYTLNFATKDGRALARQLEQKRVSGTSAPACKRVDVYEDELDAIPADDGLPDEDEAAPKVVKNPKPSRKVAAAADAE